MDDNKICPNHQYGEHISLTCPNHPEKRWNTKNIDFIGARSVFYNLHDDPKMGPPCECPWSTRVHICEPLRSAP